MATQIEVKKNGTENNTSLLRRFSRRVMDAGIIFKVKGNRYSERKPSKLTNKKQALRRLSRREEYETLKKLGKVPTNDHK
jgi:ribosomal protein S21